MLIFYLSNTGLTGRLVTRDRNVRFDSVSILFNSGHLTTNSLVNSLQ